MKHHKLKLRILIGSAVFFFISMFICILLNNSLGNIIMGIGLFTFIYYTLFLMYDLYKPIVFYEAIASSAGDDIKKPKFWGYTFTAAMVSIGIFWLIASSFIWFIYYI
jgi:hypothetical protein